MSEIYDFAKSLVRAQAVAYQTGAQSSTQVAIERISTLEMALTKLVRLVDDVIDSTEGHHPSPDAGCLVCTSGTVPHSLNTGLCAYHNARKLLGTL